jgi:polyvinyl alcohol dehydrogenase (cytochrome)
MSRLSGATALLAVFAALVSYPATASGAEWPTYQHDLARTGFQPSDLAINESSVGILAPNWTIAANSTISAQAIAANGLIYWGSWDGFEHATDPSTGAEVWRTFLGHSKSLCKNVPNLGVASTASVATIQINTIPTTVLFVGDGGVGSYYALDANTGKILWSTFIASPKKGYFLWSSPALYNGSLYAGVASIDDCPLVPGELVKLNATTGAIEAIFHTTPAGCNGGGIWSSPAIDEASGTVYATTGNVTCEGGTGPYADAILQLTANLSVIAAWRPPVKGNYDFGASPTLFSATREGTPRSLVGAVNKNGVYYALDRTNLAAGPVWQAHVTKSGLDANSIASSAWDGTRIYVSGGKTKIGTTECEGSMRALDPSTGRFVWSDCLGGGRAFGAVTAVPGVVFEGLGSILYGVSSGTGEVLFHFQEPSLSWFYSPAMVSGGALYIGNSDGNFYRFTLGGL